LRFTVVAVSFFLLCAFKASAADFVDEATRIRFPDAIALMANEPAPATCDAATPALCRGPVRRYPDPGLGIGLSYSLGGNLVTASVFIYDLGETGFPDGPGSGIVARQYDAMKDEIRSMQTLADYRNVRLVSEDTGDATSIGPLKVRVARFSYERGGRQFLSDAYLSALRGKLLKVRVTYRADLDAAKASSERFMAELGALIAEALGSRSVNVEEPATTDRRRS
jgi:hypothetical protein